MEEKIRRSGLNRKQIVQKAGLEQSYGYKLLKGTRRTKQRDYLLALYLALRCTLEETQQFLDLYGMPVLDEGKKRDRVLMQAFADHLSVEDTDDLLENRGCALLRNALY